MEMLGLTLRASAVLAAALLAATLVRRRQAALRHRIIAAGLFLAVATMPLSVMLPSWDLPYAAVPASPAADRTSVAVTAALDTGTAPAEPVDIDRMAAAAWLAGFLVSSALLVAGVVRLMRLTRRAAPVDDPRWLRAAADLAATGAAGRVALLRTERRDLLATWGWRRPRVLLPAHCDTWSASRIAVVLGHEFAHIRRADWAVQIAAECARAVFWFNPLFWIACARLRRESEQACDEAVLDAGVPAAEYASHLIAIARACRPGAGALPVMPIARPSTLEWRISAMLNTSASRAATSRGLTTFAVAALVAVTIPAASFRAFAQADPRPLTGSIYDTTGGVLPQVSLRLQDASGLTREAATDSAGRYQFEPVPAGRYLLSSALPGFLPLNQELTLREPRDWERAVTLQVATLQETITVIEPRPSGAPPVVMTAGEPMKIGGNIKPPRKILDVRPVYPAAMLEAGFEGVVPMAALIDVEGRVASVRVVSAQVHPELAQAAVDAVRQWRFTPTLLNGAAVEVSMMVSVGFSLPD
jgi:TonB family protein